MPEEPEVEGKSFRFWYSRDDEGTAVRFVPDEGPLWPEADSECSLYASFTDDEAQQEEPVFRRGGRRRRSAGAVGRTARCRGENASG